MLGVFVRCVLGALAVGVTAFALKINLDLAALMYAQDADARFNYQAFAWISAVTKLALPAGMALVAGARTAKAIGWAVVCGFVFYDVVGAIAYDLLTRGAPAERAAGVSSSRAKIEAEIADFRRRADEIKARTVAEVEADRRKADAEAAACGKKYAPSEPRCTLPAILEAEKARAVEKAGYEDEWKAARLKRDAIKDEGTPPADALAKAFFIVSGAVGLKPSSEANALLFGFRLILCLEFIPSLASFFAMHGLERAPRPAAPPAKPSAPSPPAPPAGGPKGGRKPATGTADVLAALRELAGGTRTAAGVSAGASGLTGSQRALAAGCGVSAARMNAVLRELAAAGIVSVASGPAGTCISIK